MAKKSKSLVCEHLEKVSGQLLEDFTPLISGYVKGRKGVYALYSGDKLYYVGLASNMKNRLKAHLNDRHKGKWDKFSVYLARDDEHLRELEALVIRIAAPKGNTIKGKFANSTNIKPRLTEDIKEYYEQEMVSILGGKKKKKPATTAPDSKEHKTQLGPYITKRFNIRADYKGYIYSAKVHKDGTIVYEGKKYNSPSLAGIAVNKKKTVNGWKFWKYRDDNGEWVYIDELRKGNKRTGKGKQNSKKTYQREATLAPYVNSRFTIKAKYKGDEYRATVRKNGKINYRGDIYNSPSLAGIAVLGRRPCDGWRFWKYRNEDGEWVILDELRNPSKKKTVKKGNSNKSSKREATLAPYVKSRFTIKAKYKGQEYKATVRKDGTINYNGEIFTSPSYAGKAIVGRAVQGPMFWKYRNDQGEWVPLAELIGK